MKKSLLLTYLNNNEIVFVQHIGNVFSYKVSDFTSRCIMLYKVYYIERTCKQIFIF